MEDFAISVGRLNYLKSNIAASVFILKRTFQPITTDEIADGPCAAGSVTVAGR
jgi:hypothetical protein